MKYVRKRDGKLEAWDYNRISEAVWKASQAVGNDSKTFAYQIGNQVIKEIESKFGSDGVPTVEEIQDQVERVLIRRNLTRMAKAYILYRHQHEGLRELATSLTGIDLMDNYLSKSDWKVNENSNMAFSLQGLNNYISTEITKNYWLNKIYPPNIREAHHSGDFHIHNLNLLAVYCVGWDLYDLLKVGFRGAPGKIECRPPKHFRSALGQIVNFFYTLQGEAAGAQAFSNLDTLLSPFIRYDNLNYDEVKQCLQEFMFNTNVPTRVGFQTPFTNCTLDLIVPSYYNNFNVLANGKQNGDLYSDFQDEIDIFNKALLEIYGEGDASGRVFTFPIPTYNITKDFKWDNPNLDGLWYITAKYGIPYFANFVNSEMKVEDSYSICCRLRLDLSKLDHKGGGYFGASGKTGSIGVVTINMPRLGYISKDKDEFLENLDSLMDLSKDSLELKRKMLERFTENNLYPYTKFYLRDIKNRFGKYWKNHFSTIGLVGMNEACLNLIREEIATKSGIKLTLDTLDFMRDKLIEFQMETGNSYNLEATPAESTSYDLAKLDKAKYKKIICANEDYYRNNNAEPFYTNSSQLPVNFTDSLLHALDLQDEIQTKYTGGTVMHLFLGEKVDNYEAVKHLIKYICNKYKLSYLTLTPTFSICTTHGYINGEQPKCPSCNKITEVYSRVCGYLRPVSQWNFGKQAEFKTRKTFLLDDNYD